RLARRDLGVPLGRLVGEVAERHAPATTAAPALALSTVFRDRADAEAQERLHVVHDPAVAAGDQNLADLFRERGLDLDDARVECVRGLARALEQPALFQPV